MILGKQHRLVLKYESLHNRQQRKITLQVKVKTFIFFNATPIKKAESGTLRVFELCNFVFRIFFFFFTPLYIIWRV